MTLIFEIWNVYRRNSKALLGVIWQALVTNLFLFVFQGCRNPEFKGDEICDDGNNNKECDFDGGDCCLPDVEKTYCTDCKCKEFEEGLE